MKHLRIDMSLKNDTKTLQQKGRAVPIHFQNILRNYLEKRIEKGHFEKADKTTENCFETPSVISIKKIRLK